MRSERPGPRLRRGFEAAALLLALMVPACVGGGRSSGNGGGGAADARGATDAARAAARRFLTTYVEPDGRVARHDQGNDTVSEGQSYALVLAEVAGDQTTFDRVWQWTSGHLTRPDGLLSAHAFSDGRVDDANAASDADVVTAWALLRDTGPASEANHDAGRRIAAAVLDHETVKLPNGLLVLAAGNWATGPTGTVNPSYWALPALTSLARTTNDDRWKQLADAAIRLTTDMTNGGRQLPPDWAQVDGTTVTPIAAPNHQVPDVRYSFDAQRVVPWFAAAASTAADLAGEWSSVLDDEHARAMALATDGTVVDGRAHPVALVAAAAAASAAGHTDVRDRRLGEAEALDATQPTYFGSAWVALGRALLTTDLLRT